MMKYVHTPVLLRETLEYLAPRGRDELFVDATMGEGGHSFAFLTNFPDLKITGIEADSDIQAVARERLKSFGERVHFYLGWSQDFFADYPSELKRPDTIFADLGISLFHYEKGGRGFSFQNDEKLDMRIDVSRGMTAAELIAGLPEKELADILYNNAGERYSRRIAAAIAESRRLGTIATTGALVSIVEKAVPAEYRHGPIHPATRTFQALRIAVNRELSQLHALLESALRILEPGGRLGIITFHSAEDRIVKNFFRYMNKDCTCPPHTPICRCEGRRHVNILTKKGICPSDSEIQSNPPSRSARLRVVEKILDGAA